MTTPSSSSANFAARLLIAKTAISSILIFTSIAGILSALFAFVSLALDQWMYASRSTAPFRQSGASSSVFYEDQKEQEKSLTLGIYSFCRKSSNCIFSFYNPSDMVADNQIASIGCDSGQYLKDSVEEASKRTQLGSLSASILALCIIGAVFSIFASFSSLIALGLFGKVQRKGYDDNDDDEPNYANDGEYDNDSDNDNNSSVRRDKYDHGYYTSTNFPIYDSKPRQQRLLEQQQRSYQWRKKPSSKNKNKNNKNASSFEMDASKFKHAKYERDENLSINMSDFRRAGGGDQDGGEEEEEDATPCCVSVFGPILPSLVLPFFFWSFLFFGLALLLWTILESSILNCSWDYSFCDSILASSKLPNSILGDSTNGLLRCGFSFSFDLVAASTALTFASFVLLILNRCCFGKSSDALHDEEQFADRMMDEDDEMNRVNYEAENEQRTKVFRDEKVHGQLLSSRRKKYDAIPPLLTDISSRRSNDNNYSYVFETITSPRIPSSISNKAAANIYFSDKVALQEECLARHARVLGSLIISARVFETERRQRKNISNVEMNIRIETENKKKGRVAAGSISGVANGGGALSAADRPAIQILDVNKDVTKMAKQFAIDNFHQDQSSIFFPDDENVVDQEEPQLMKSVAEDLEQSVNLYEPQAQQQQTQKQNQNQKPSATPSRNLNQYDDQEEYDDDDFSSSSTLTDTTEQSRQTNNTNNNQTNQNINNTSNITDDENSSSVSGAGASPKTNKPNLVSQRKRPSGTERFRSSVSSSNTAIQGLEEGAAAAAFKETPPKLPRALLPVTDKNHSRMMNNQLNDDDDDFSDEEQSSNVHQQHQGTIGGLTLLKLQPPKINRNNDSNQQPRGDDSQPHDRFGRPLPKALLQDYHPAMPMVAAAASTEDQQQPTSSSALLRHSPPSNRFADPNKRSPSRIVEESNNNTAQQQQPSLSSSLTSKAEALRQRLNYYHVAEHLLDEYKKEEGGGNNNKNNDDNGKKTRKPRRLPPLDPDTVQNPNNSTKQQQSLPQLPPSSYLVSPAVSPVPKNQQQNTNRDQNHQNYLYDEDNIRDPLKPPTSHQEEIDRDNNDGNDDEQGPNKNENNNNSGIKSFQQYWQRKRSNSGMSNTSSTVAPTMTNDNTTTRNKSTTQSSLQKDSQNLEAIVRRNEPNSPRTREEVQRSTSRPRYQ